MLEESTDLALPVVDPSGYLDRTHLSSAKAGVPQLDGISEGIAEDTVEKRYHPAGEEFGDTDFEQTGLTDSDSALRRESRTAS